MDVNLGGRTAEGFSALYFASALGHGEMVRLLLSLPNINLDQGEPRENFTTPLLEATAIGNTDVVEILLGHQDIDVNRGVSGLTPLYVSSTRGYASIVELLIRHPNTNVNEVSSRGGMTALGIACHFGHTEVAKMLLRCKKTDVDARNMTLIWQGEEEIAVKAPLDYAKERGFDDIVKAFETRDNLLQLGETC